MDGKIDCQCVDKVDNKIFYYIYLHMIQSVEDNNTFAGMIFLLLKDMCYMHLMFICAYLDQICKILMWFVALFISRSLSFRYPSYCGSNIWPHSALPELEVGMLTKYYYIPLLAFKRDLFCLLEIVS